MRGPDTQACGRQGAVGEAQARPRLLLLLLLLPLLLLGLISAGPPRQESTQDEAQQLHCDEAVAAEQLPHKVPQPQQPLLQG